MHGLIFETSIWLLAGSTRLLCVHKLITAFQFSFTTHQHKPLGTNSELICYLAACREGSFCTVFHTALTHAIDTTSLSQYSVLASHKEATCLNTALITLREQPAALITALKKKISVGIFPALHRTGANLLIFPFSNLIVPPYIYTFCQSQLSPKWTCPIHEVPKLTIFPISLNLRKQTTPNFQVKCPTVWPI